MTTEDEASPFSYVLSEDKTRLKLALHEGEYQYSAEQVESILRFFLARRFEMVPAVPEDSQKATLTLEADRYDARQNPEDGTAQIRIRIPGLGWTYVTLSKADCLGLSELLNPPLAAPETPKH